MDARGVLLQGHAALLQKCKRHCTYQRNRNILQAGKQRPGTNRQPNDQHGGCGQFSWGDYGHSALYDFSTDFTTSLYADAQKLDLTATNCYVYNDTTSTWASAGGDLLTAGKKIYFDATLSEYSYKGEGKEIERAAMPGDDGTLYCLLTGSDGVVKSLPMTQETTATDPDDPSPDTPANRKLWYCEIPEGTYTAVQFSTTNEQSAPAYN